MPFFSLSFLQLLIIHVVIGNIHVVAITADMVKLLQFTLSPMWHALQLPLRLIPVHTHEAVISLTIVTLVWTALTLVSYL